MIDTEPKISEVAIPNGKRRMIRYVASAMAAITSGLYFLIGFGVVTVVEHLDGTKDALAQSQFGIAAGFGFLLGALLILSVDRRWVWAMGAAVEAFIIFTYFDLASERAPNFEIWGIIIRLAQLVILVALIYLARTAQSGRASWGRRPSDGRPA